MTKRNDQGISDTVEEKRFSFEATPHGGKITVHGPYENTVIQLSGEQLAGVLAEHKHLHMQAQSRHDRLQRERGNEARYNPDRGRGMER